MKATFHTLGCKLNYAETSAFMNQFRKLGFEVSDDIRQPAKVCVINTCSVTGKADSECRQIVRRALRHAPDAYIIVVGCYAQLAPEEIASIDGVDLVLGSSEKFSILEYADREFRKSGTPAVRVAAIDEASGFGPAYSFDGDRRTRSFLKIQDGCDYHCTFCTIPLARGMSRSQSVDNTIAQARSLVDEGFREIVLTGVNVGDYGKKTESSLIDLVKELEKIDGLRRVRISSIEPNLLNDELLEFWSSSKVLVPHFHIPLQSGDDSVLKLMRRRYTTGYYAGLIEKIMKLIPDAGIGADVIAGFPGETDAGFENTYRFLVQLPVSYLHVFTYSERENTPAAKLPGRIPVEERTRRTRMLRILSRKKHRAYMERFIGRRVDVLFEESFRNGYITGLTKEYVRVAVSSQASLLNTMADVRIDRVDEELAFGSIMEPEKTPHAYRHRTFQLPVVQG